MERLKSASDHQHCNVKGDNKCSAMDSCQEVQSVDIHNYQDHMVTVVKGGQHRALGATFCNIVHFKK
eukprot:10205525-Ditylum_brightwellii.AAC.1